MYLNVKYIEGFILRCGTVLNPIPAPHLQHNAHPLAKRAYPYDRSLRDYFRPIADARKLLYWSALVDNEQILLKGLKLSNHETSYKCPDLK